MAGAGLAADVVFVVGAAVALVDGGEAFVMGDDGGLVAASQGVAEGDGFAAGFLMVEGGAVEGRRDGFAKGAVACAELFVEVGLVCVACGAGGAEGDFVSLVEGDVGDEVLAGGDHGFAGVEGEGIVLGEGERAFGMAVEGVADLHGDGGVLLDDFAVFFGAGAGEGLEIAEVFAGADGGDEVSLRGLELSADEIRLGHAGVEMADGLCGGIGMEGAADGEASRLRGAECVLKELAF